MDYPRSTPLVKYKQYVSAFRYTRVRSASPQVLAIFEQILHPLLNEVFAFGLRGHFVAWRRGVAGVEAGRGEPRPYEVNLCWGIGDFLCETRRTCAADELMAKGCCGRQVGFRRRASNALGKPLRHS